MVRLDRVRLFVSLLLPAACGGGAPGVPEPVEGPRFVVFSVAEAAGRPYAAPFARNGLGETAGTAGPEAWHPLNVALVVEANGNATVLEGDGQPAFAFGLNDAGLAVGESGRRACAWEAGTLRFLKAPDGVFSGSAHACNGDGLIVGSAGDYDDGAGPVHCAWPSADAEPLVLDGLGNTLGSAWAVNAAGQIAGVSGGVEGTFYAARWDGVDATPVRIGPLPGAMNSEARAINALGDVAGRSSFADGRIQAFRHVKATSALLALPFLPGGAGYSEAFGLNDAGDVVGTARVPGAVVHAALWRDGKAYDLNIQVLDLEGPGIAWLASANAIDNDGRIACEAVMKSGLRRIVVLAPAPEPLP